MNTKYVCATISFLFAISGETKDVVDMFFIVVDLKDSDFVFHYVDFDYGGT